LSAYTIHIPPPCDEEIEVLYSDDHLLVVRKPAGLLSVPGRIVKDCALSRLQFDYPDIQIVHRLDLDTSGILVFSLSKLATSDINRQFRERIVKKRYVAVVHGCVLEDKGEIELALRPDPENRPRQLVDMDKGKWSLTNFEVLDRESNQTRLNLFPLTGRSHQLRIHMAEIGHPILGCDLYAHEKAFNMADRLLLHAAEIHFTHPVTKDWLTFENLPPF
jgi:tRNA pseudouridine32 synthase/23S rRNA pseudouridine746 synthase